MRRMQLNAPSVAAACAAALLFSTAPPTPAGAAIVPLPVNQPADYQLSGAYPPPPGVTVTTRDWRDPAPRRGYGICYVNGFQSQPEHGRWWRRNHPDLLLRNRSGRLVEDRNWPGEYLLDITTKAKRRGLTRIVSRWLRRCAAAGYRAVEPDNLDSWTRSHGLIRRRHTDAMARSLVRAGHNLGLAVAQKNAVEIVGRRIGFDFAVAEDCQVYRECGRYVLRYGQAVIEIEYADGAGWRGYRAACRARGAAITVVFRDRLLRRPGQRGYRFATC